MMIDEYDKVETEEKKIFQKGCVYDRYDDDGLFLMSWTGRIYMFFKDTLSIQPATRAARLRLRLGLGLMMMMMMMIMRKGLALSMFTHCILCIVVGSN